MDYAPNLQLTVDICDSISPPPMPAPSLDELPRPQGNDASPDTSSTEIINSLSTVSEHCYSNNAVVNPSVEKKREAELRKHA